MLGFIVAGGMGAVVNYALFSHWLSSGLFLPVDSLLRDLGVVIQLGAAITTLISVLFGFFGGTLFVIVWHFLKTRVVRFLLSSDVWFLTPKHPLTKVSLFVIAQCIISTVYLGLLSDLLHFWLC